LLSGNLKLGKEIVQAIDDEGAEFRHFAIVDRHDGSILKALDTRALLPCAGCPESRLLLGSAFRLR